MEKLKFGDKEQIDKVKMIGRIDEWDSLPECGKCEGVGQCGHCGSECEVCEGDGKVADKFRQKYPQFRYVSPESINRLREEALDT